MVALGPAKWAIRDFVSCLLTSLAAGHRPGLEETRPPRFPALTKPRARQSWQHLGAKIRQLVEIVDERDRNSPEPQLSQPRHVPRHQVRVSDQWQLAHAVGLVIADALELFGR